MCLIQIAEAKGRLQTAQEAQRVADKRKQELARQLHTACQGLPMEHEGGVEAGVRQVRKGC